MVESSMSLPKVVLDKYVNHVFIETGTGAGAGIQLAHECGFGRIITIDSYEPATGNAKRLMPEIECICADSPIVLGAVIDGIPKQQAITFWLDAHSHFPGQRPCTTAPEELAIIRGRPWHKGSVILIDDWSWFGESTVLVGDRTLTTSWGDHTNKWDMALAIAPFIARGFSVTWESNILGAKDILVLQEGR